MKKIVILLPLLLILLTSARTSTPSTPVIPREKPDMEEIRRTSIDPTSRYYFPKLMKAFQAEDTLMTLDQFRHLYLGYIFQEDYDPYRRSPYTSRVEELYLRDQHTHAECDTIIHYAELSLKDDPFDLRQMTFLIYAYREKKKTHMASIMEYKFKKLLETIVSTGTGADQENAWIVNNPQHEYNLLNFQGYRVDSQEDVEPYYDLIYASPADDENNSSDDVEAKTFYFNVRYVLTEYNRKHPDY